MAFLHTPTARPEICRWPAQVRHVCGLLDLALEFLGQHPNGEQCGQDCGPGRDIKTATRVVFGAGAQQSGKEGCGASGYVGSRSARLCAAWNDNLWTSSVVVEWWAYRWNANPESLALVQAKWLGVTLQRGGSVIGGVNAERCAIGVTLLATVTAFDDGTFTLA